MQYTLQCGRTSVAGFMGEASGYGSKLSECHVQFLHLLYNLNQMEDLFLAMTWMEKMAACWSIRE